MQKNKFSTEEQVLNGKLTTIISIEKDVSLSNPFEDIVESVKENINKGNNILIKSENPINVDLAFLQFCSSAKKTAEQKNTKIRFEIMLENQTYEIFKKLDLIKILNQ